MIGQAQWCTHVFLACKRIMFELHSKTQSQKINQLTKQEKQTKQNKNAEIEPNMKDWDRESPNQNKFLPL